MTTCYPDSIKVKKDIERRIEDYVIQYCETLEENFKQYSIESQRRNIENPNIYKFFEKFEDHLGVAEKGIEFDLK